jgi:hypothetical protein
MATPPSEKIPWRIQGAIYACGLFSNSSFQVYNLVVPLIVLQMLAGLAALIMPVIIGAIAEVVGIENSFYIIGALVVGALAMGGVRMSRVFDFTDNGPASR